MTVMSFKLFSLCFIAYCSWLCAVSSEKPAEQVGSLLLALKGGRGGGGGPGGGFGRPCKSGSDCTGKDEGCFTVHTPRGSLSICLLCDEETNGVKQFGGKYDVDGCGAQTKTWIIVGIVAGVVLVAAVIISLVVCCLVPSCPLAKRRNNRNEQYGQYPQADGQGQGQGQYEGQQVQYDGQQGQYQGQPYQYQGQPSQYQEQPGYQGQPGQYQVQPGYQGQPGQYQVQPGYQGQPGQYQSPQGQYQAAPVYAYGQAPPPQAQ